MLRMNRVSRVPHLRLIPTTSHKHPSLDSVGIAGFSHSFGTLEGKPSTIADIFDSFGKLKLTFFQILIFILGPVFPVLAHTPSSRRTLEARFNSASDEISRKLLERTRKTKEGTIEGQRDHSVIGLLSMFELSTGTIILGFNADSDPPWMQSRLQLKAQICICLKTKLLLR